VRRLIAVIACSSLLGIVPVSSEAADVVVEPISFQVSNPLDPGATYEVAGNLYRPSVAPDCEASVMLLVHGLSYGAWGWDFPVEPETYSVARALAARGFPAVSIDLPGYGASTKPNGYVLTVQSYAAMTDQMIASLRADHGFARVGLIGHSAGTEISELTAGIFGSADAVMATAYHHFPSERIVREFITGDMTRAAMDDYEYFGGTVENRTEYMYWTDNADPAVIAADTELANMTPSGEILSIGSQPSRFTIEAIDVPVLLVLAEHDVLFPPVNEGQDVAAAELALFAASPDASLHIVGDAGHSFHLHRNAPASIDAIGDWLDARAGVIPSCPA